MAHPVAEINKDMPFKVEYWMSIFTIDQLKHISPITSYLISYQINNTTYTLVKTVYHLLSRNFQIDFEMNVAIPTGVKMHSSERHREMQIE